MSDSEKKSPILNVSANINAWFKCCNNSINDQHNDKSNVAGQDSNKVEEIVKSHSKESIDMIINDKE